MNDEPLNEIKRVLMVLTNEPGYTLTVTVPNRYFIISKVTGTEEPDLRSSTGLEGEYKVTLEKIGDSTFVEKIITDPMDFIEMVKDWPITKIDVYKKAPAPQGSFRIWNWPVTGKSPPRQRPTNYEIWERPDTYEKGELMNEIQSPVYTPYNDSNCAICLESMRGTKNCTVSPCLHTFHCDCIFEWININPSKKCPICRTPINKLTRKSKIVPLPSEFGNKKKSYVRLLRDLKELNKC